MSSEVIRPRIARLHQSVLRWYVAKRRELPWRRTRDPYCIWVSEIMLQQTRVSAVLEHYQRWLGLFPDVNSLAAANLDDVLAAWSGLGYYRRARMLHEAAKVVASEMNGVIPRTSAELRKLPGVGRYTAAAIASIAFDEPAAVVDGNVERVLSRFYSRELSQQENWEIAQEWLNDALAARVRTEASGPSARGTGGDWNQAMMELGATVCTPVNPQCGLCPLQNWCEGRAVAQNGEKAAKGNLPVRKRITAARALVQRTGRVYLVQRPPDAKKMAGMWELPEIALDQNTEPLLSVRHSITDTDYLVHIHPCQPKGIRGGRWFDNSDLGRIALTGLSRKVLRKAGLFAN